MHVDAHDNSGVSWTKGQSGLLGLSELTVLEGVNYLSAVHCIM